MHMVNPCVKSSRPNPLERPRLAGSFGPIDRSERSGGWCQERSELARLALKLCPGAGGGE